MYQPGLPSRWALKDWLRFRSHGGEAIAPSRAREICVKSWHFLGVLGAIGGGLGLDGLSLWPRVQDGILVCDWISG